jgi:hypothetical protein
MAEFVVCGFKTEYTNGKAVDWVELAPSGEAFERTHTWHRIKDVTPKQDVDETRAGSQTHQAALARWDVIRPKYEAFKAGNELPEDGTPLAAWAGVTPEMAAYLRRMGIHTLEGVRDMSEATAVKLPFPNARKLASLAGDYLASVSATQKDQEMAAMRERMAIMEEMIAAAQAEPEKRGPGRPRKEAA